MKTFKIKLLTLSIIVFVGLICTVSNLYLTTPKSIKVKQ